MPGSFSAVYNGTKAFLADVVAGLKNKLQAAATAVLPSEVLAERHRKMAQPGTSKHR